MLKQQQRSAKCCFVFLCTLASITAAECTVTSIIKLCDEENQKARIKDVLESTFFVLTDLFKSFSELPGLTPEQRTRETSQQ